ncbi:MXAN_6230/SCO0854 family RING domain-containing protein [Streptomyces mashuensis]|uniref:MXAN_6230/SCO0854 family RING domain-containing protein n=1 Tax=Streptomyces mashuensis TaxID=33904 RepID=UPI001E390D38|nr:MXAN_6230/SCO0854 family RING domain-containing protein [Streptomyces mashuensis]
MSTLQSVLLRRAGTVHVDHEPARPSGASDAMVAQGLAALEAELLDRGFALTEPLRTALAGAGAGALADTGRGLLHAIDEQLGADRTHMPLFRDFPRSVPQDTFALYTDRVFALLLQQPRQPCVLCGTVGAVRPVSPCAHLVCRSCWDGADYAGCPLCHRRIDRNDPFLRPARRKSPTVSRQSGPLRLLVLGTSRTADAAAELAALLARPVPLSPQDREDLRVLLLHAVPGGLDWLPAQVPVRETKALALGTLLREAGPETVAEVRRRLPALLTTATDVLRLLCVWSGGEPDPVRAPRLRNVPRPLRRDLLGVLDGLDPASLVEDVHRHARVWKRAAEVLHPYAYGRRFELAALALATVRGTDLAAAGDLGAALLRRAGAHPGLFAVRTGGGVGTRTRVAPVTWGGVVEDALRAGDVATAVELLGARPGELVRRLGHLLRLEGAPEAAPALTAALRRGLPAVAPGPLLSALGALRAAQRPGGRRVFFPRGQVGRAYGADDARAPLAQPVAGAVCALLEGEVLRRLGEAPPYDLAVLDPGLRRLTVPFAERTAAASLVAVPRGSELRLPEGGVVRLFLHWTQPEGVQVDLDLSVAFFDAGWNRVGLCDYTRLRYGGDAAVHSGDLTSAPAPDGATEYVDLDVAGLAAAGARYAVAVVFSYNDIPFEELPDAFAGFMALPAAGRDASYDPRSVRQRFDLAGESRVCVPMLVDLAEGRAVWTDVHLPGENGVHSVGRHGDALGVLGRDLWTYFSGGARLTLWELACWHAAARAGATVVPHRSAGPGGTDELWRFRRRRGEDVAAFAARLRAGAEPDGREPAEDVLAAAAGAAAGRHVFVALAGGDLPAPRATGTLHRLFPGRVDAWAAATRVTAGDLLTALAPAA